MRALPLGHSFTLTLMLGSLAVFTSACATSSSERASLYPLRPDVVPGPPIADPPLQRATLHIALTAKGRALIDAATETRFAEATRSLPPLGQRETRQLAHFLRTWLSAIGER